MNLTIDATEVLDLATAWNEAPELVQRELTAATLEGEILLEREIKDDTPVGVTGQLRASITAFDPVVAGNNVIGVVGTSLAHALPVELGTRPHFPPLKPLIDWVRAKLDVQQEQRAVGIALAIARKIAARGTLAVGMFHRNFNANRFQVEGFYAQANERIAEGLANGR